MSLKSSFQLVAVALCTLVGFALLVSTSVVYAASPWIVNNNGDGTANAANCTAGNPNTCRLRDAIEAASYGDTITFDGDYLIAVASELTIAKNLTIDGAGHVVTINGNHATRVFNVTAGNVAFNHLTIANGYSTNHGGGIWNSGTLTVTYVTFLANMAANGGGGVYNDSSNLTLMNVTFSGNSANNGGGVYSFLSAQTLTNVTFTGNIANTGGGGGMYINGNITTLANVTFSDNSAPDGGGVFNDNSNSTFTNVTFSHNSATEFGGGMFNTSNPTLTNVTFSGNYAGTGGGIWNYSGTTTLRNTIIANSTSGGNCASSAFGNITDGGGNLENSAICGFSVTNGSFPNSNPLLGTLGNYGGGTQTIPLLLGSLAINAGKAATCPTLDQRGKARVGVCDIGSFESQGFALTQMNGDNQSAVVNTAFAHPLVISVTSAYAEPVDGGVITFVGPLNGASTNPITNTATITNGAAAQSVTANGTAGAYSVVASASGAPSVVNFLLSNTPLPPPIANAGPDQSVHTGKGVTLDGSASTDPSNFLPLTYHWQQTGGLAVTLGGANNVTATFTSPLITQTQVLAFMLTVTDSQQLVSQPDLIAITVEPYRVLLPIILK